MAILIDNYDSFTYNLVHAFGELGVELDVYRNDAASADEIISKNPDMIIISPGPATPDSAGICLDLIEQAAENNIPLLGICLGHQCIGQVFGGNVIRAPQPIHGKTWKMRHSENGIFAGIPQDCEFTRYHSLIVDNDTLPDCLKVSATSDKDDLIMGLEHTALPIVGVQFHPESIASHNGNQLLKNFIDMARTHNE